MEEFGHCPPWSIISPGSNRVGRIVVKDRAGVNDPVPFSIDRNNDECGIRFECLPVFTCVSVCVCVCMDAMLIYIKMSCQHTSTPEYFGVGLPSRSFKGRESQRIFLQLSSTSYTFIEWRERSGTLLWLSNTQWDLFSPTILLGNSWKLFSTRAEQSKKNCSSPRRRVLSQFLWNSFTLLSQHESVRRIRNFPPSLQFVTVLLWFGTFPFFLFIFTNLFFFL